MTRLLAMWAVVWVCLFTVVQVADAATPEAKPVLVDDLVAVVLHEARGEPFGGMLAVAGVVLDRRFDSRWPSTVDGVIYQPWQFSYMDRSRLNVTHMSIAEINAAIVAVDLASHGFRACGSDVFWFHTKAIARPAWPAYIKPTCEIGGHIFYNQP